MIGHYKFDLQQGSSEVHLSGEGRSPGEPVFVPAAGADPDSDEGYVMTFVFDKASNSSTTLRSANVQRSSPQKP